MKKIFCASFSLGIMIAATFAGGCATPLPLGMVYTEVILPVTTPEGDLSFTKKGTAECKSFLGLVATGDSSIRKAAENGGIKKVKHVEYKTENVLGLVGTYTTIVYGD